MTDEFDYEAEDEFIERDEEHPGKARVADLRTMNDEILNKHRNTMLKGINASLADGKMSEILDLPILTEQLQHTDTRTANTASASIFLLTTAHIPSHSTKRWSDSIMQY